MVEQDLARQRMAGAGVAPVAVVTGAGTGIGRAVAMLFLREGFRVVLAGRRAEPLQETVTLSGVDGARARVVPTNVGVPDQVRALFDAAVDAFGRVDVVFNNAGIGAPPVELFELTDAQWQDAVNVNLSGPFYCTREAFRVMKDQVPRGGRIINNGSISATAPRPNSAPYTATKHAVSGLTKAAALDGRKYDIAVGQIDIGNAATDMTERMTQGVKQANGTMMVEPRMDVAHVATSVLHMARLPLDANVLFMTVMATTMPFVGRG